MSKKLLKFDLFLFVFYVSFYFNLCLTGTETVFVRELSVSSVCPRSFPKCLTLCFWQFAPIVQHFLTGGTLEDWAQSAAKECDIPF